MTVSIIGGHMTRNGIERNYPARVCLSINGNGLDEQHADTIILFRDVTVYNDGPPDLHTHPQRRTIEYARWWYADRTDGPTLRQVWTANKHRAHFFAITNELGGSDPEHIKDHIAYETNICQLASADGLKCAVGKLAGDSPNWPSNLWQQLYAPFVVDMWTRYGAIYARHAYGGNLVDGDGKPTHDQPGNPSRPFDEIAHLRTLNYGGGMVLAECGLDGGYGLADYARFQAQALGYAAALKPHADMVIGLCWYECGQTGFNANYTNHLKQIKGELDTSLPKWVAPTPPTPPADKPKIVIFKKPQKAAMTLAENQQVGEFAWNNYGRTTTHSGDDTMRMLAGGNAESYAVIPYPDRQADDIAALEEAGYRWQPMNPPPAPFQFTHWPTNDKRVTQRFLANPDNYKPFGLPGHDGVDIAAATGSPIMAAASGTVSQINTNPAASNYGIFVRVGHGEYETTYAHLQSVQAGLAVGTAVAGGQQIGKADSTGNSTGSHLHITLKRPGYAFTDKCGNQWLYNIIDPEPFMMHFTGVTWPPVVNCPPPPGQTYDMANYIVGKRDGRATQFSSGETMQYQEAGGFVYLVKNQQWEQFRIDASFIWRGKDTSPGPAPANAERPGQARWYTQYEAGQTTARWCARSMSVGQTWTGTGHTVQFYYKSDCQPSAINSGSATNKLTLFAHHASKTWGSITLPDVIECKNSTGETFWFAKDWGMVAWGSAWGNSNVTELFQPGQRTLVRESGCYA